jgi:hypothetical protein
MCYMLEYYKEQDETFFLSLPLREICCCRFSLWAACAIPQCFSRELPEENNNTSSVICWHEGLRLQPSLGFLPLVKAPSSWAYWQPPWDTPTYSSTIEISLYRVLLCFFQTFYLLNITSHLFVTLRLKKLIMGVNFRSMDPSMCRLKAILKPNPWLLRRPEKPRQFWYLEAPCRLKCRYSYAWVLVHTCNPQLFGKQRSGRSWFEASLGKKLMRSQLNKLGKVTHSCNPSYASGVDRRIMVQGWSWAKARPHLENNKSKKS